MIYGQTQIKYTHKTLVRICQAKSTVEDDIQMCLREIDCEVNSFDCARRDTHICKCGTGPLWYCTCMEILDWLNTLKEIENSQR